MLPLAVSCIVGRGEAIASLWRDSPSAPGTAVRRSRGFFSDAPDIMVIPAPPYAAL